MFEEHDPCSDGEPTEPTSTSLVDRPDEWVGAGDAVDLVLPGEIRAWMNDRLWEQSHNAWHNVRRCLGTTGIPHATDQPICTHPELIAAHQQCQDNENGYEFLVVHRHMIQALRQAFPGQHDLFAGFTHFPTSAEDVPEAWRDRWTLPAWSDEVSQTATMLEDIENNLDQFPTEGDLGLVIQCGGMNTPLGGSIHGAMHVKWAVNDSPYSLLMQTRNLDNYMFWKLHGWIDDIWERYRVAKGLARDEPELKTALLEQCREMHRLGMEPDSAIEFGDHKALPIEHGVFSDTIRPILNKHCSGCHDASSPEVGMALNGVISSADVVQGLVNVAAVHGGQFKRVLPGDPDHSWLYLKAAGLASDAECIGENCNTQVMPPTGQVTLSNDELAAIRAWIADGAAPPTR